MIQIDPAAHRRYESLRLAEGKRGQQSCRHPQKGWEKGREIIRCGELPFRGLQQGAHGWATKLFPSPDAWPLEGVGSLPVATSDLRRRERSWGAWIRQRIKTRVRVIYPVQWGLHELRMLESQTALTYFCVRWRK